MIKKAQFYELTHISSLSEGPKVTNYWIKKLVTLLSFCD